MNKLSLEKRAKIFQLMVEGCSIRSITRILDVSKGAVLKLLCDAGQAFLEYQDKVLVNLCCKKIQVDEIWSFVNAKKKNVPGMKNQVEGAGDSWTWVAICSQTKLVPSWYVGSRDSESGRIFIADLASRINHRIQLFSDGYHVYLEAVEASFGKNIDYGMLIKTYGPPINSNKSTECVGYLKEVISGNVSEDDICTSYVERQNLTIRMSNRRFARLTNAFSKKQQNHMYAMAIYFMHYNFVRIHKTIKVTPAMEAGIIKELWSFENMVDILEDWEKNSK